jgi:death-on-curing protein
LVSNHPFVDGNKRVGHAAMSIFLDLNGYAVEASVDEQETVVLRVATGEISRAALANWLESHIHPKR